MARPKLDIDPEQVQKLAKFGVSNVAIAEFFGCSEATIRQGFFDSLTKGRAERKITLHQRQYEAADNGNIAMLIWLGKQDLGQTEKVETKNETRTFVAPDAQARMMANPKAVELACDLDEAIAAPPAKENDRAKANGHAVISTGADAGRVRAPCKRR
jgi:hypothetical protein